MAAVAAASGVPAVSEDCSRGLAEQECICIEAVAAAEHALEAAVEEHSCIEVARER